jgi:hypothetical protein
MKTPRPLLVLTWLLIALPRPGSADQSGTARPSTVLWATCSAASPAAEANEPPISLHQLAMRARPALWFSPDEPLLDLSGPVVREWPRVSGSLATPEDVVYYRITRIKAESADRDLVRAVHERLPESERPLITEGQANPALLAKVPLEPSILQHIREFVIRYLFYYPNELGAHSHAHDLESVELRVVVEDADEMGNPAAVSKLCRQIRVATFYGAAHGLGLYTNVLDLDLVLKDRLADTVAVLESTSRRTPVAPGRAGDPGVPAIVAAPPATVEKLIRTDPFWPLLVLVEEGKHASAPDRNGDGIFTPNYDVNRYSADAWGVRDTMRSRQLSPAFRSDTFKKRLPEITVADDGTFRQAETQSSWAGQAFSRYVRYDYELRQAIEDAEICGDPMRSIAERERSMKTYADRLTAQVGQGHPDRLLSGKGFCDDTSVHSRTNAADVFGRIGFGGAYNGFTHWWERISGSVRFDGGVGWSTTIPVALQMPGLGGWVVGRLAGPMPGQPARKSADVAYMPSASRFADWYVAGGLDYGHYESGSIVEDGARFAIESGMKFRFPIPDWGTFFGARVGIRVNGMSPLHTPRLVFEIGAGIW